ncbi:MAG: sigma-E factor negative regulatory protein [Cellvibrionaceae bacterium]
MSTKEQSAQQQLNESLSAFMDGEASELEIRRLLKSEDTELNSRWHRYQLAGSAMRKEVELNSAIDLSAGISAAIAEEPALSMKAAKSTKSGFWGNIGRFGIAASVAGAVVVGVQLTSLNTAVNIAEVPTKSVPAPATGSPTLPDASVSVVGNQQNSQEKPIIINEATREQLQQMEGEVNRLMLEHAQNASQNTQQGVLPFVRVPDAESK